MSLVIFNWYLVNCLYIHRACCFSSDTYHNILTINNEHLLTSQKAFWLKILNSFRPFFCLQTLRIKNSQILTYLKEKDKTEFDGHGWCVLHIIISTYDCKLVLPPPSSFIPLYQEQTIAQIQATPIWPVAKVHSVVAFLIWMIRKKNKNYRETFCEVNKVFVLFIVKLISTSRCSEKTHNSYRKVPRVFMKAIEFAFPFELKHTMTHHKN